MLRIYTVYFQMMPNLFFHQDTKTEKKAKLKQDHTEMALHFLKINVLVPTHWFLKNDLILPIGGRILYRSYSKCLVDNE